MQLLKTKSLERYNQSLIAFAIILAILVLLVLVVSMYGKNNDSETVLIPEYTDDVVVVEEPTSREITGTVLSIDPTGEYMRVAIPNEGIFSVGINRPEYPFNEVSLLTLEPMSEITITAGILSDTDIYDFVIEESAVQLLVDTEGSAPEMTIEERLERLRLLTPEMR